MSDHEKVCLSDVRSNGNVGSKVKVNWQRHEFVEVERVQVDDQGHVEDQCEFVGCG